MYVCLAVASTAFITVGHHSRLIGIAQVSQQLQTEQEAHQIALAAVQAELEAAQEVCDSTQGDNERDKHTARRNERQRCTVPDRYISAERVSDSERVRPLQTKIRCCRQPLGTATAHSKLHLLGL